jgi:fused signal recognition particle receptor
MAGFLGKLKEKLSKTRQGLVDRITELVTGYRQVDEGFFEELEDILIQADLGVEPSLTLVTQVRQITKEQKIDDANCVKDILKEEIIKLLDDNDFTLNVHEANPAVILVVGVNGTGKTTTIGKLACKLSGEGKKVVLAAADTFRAAAIDQLAVWAERAGVTLIKHQEGSDPAAVAFDALKSARARGAEVIIIDTAGRLQTKVNLMEELKKIRRVVEREIPGAPHEVLLVLDATTGQNALSQTRMFSEAVGVTGIVLTKLDGTAKGGVVIAIKADQGVPIKLIGLGEGIEDLKEFEAREFVEALFAEELQA